jgi:hypothetical protein
MSKNDSNDTPQVQGDPNPNKRLNWLEEVKADAEFNYRKRLRDQEEKEAYEASKREGNPNPNIGK